MNTKERKNLEKELIEFAEKSYARDKIEAICYGGMRYGGRKYYRKPKREEYAFLTKLFDSDDAWDNFEKQVMNLELHLLAKYRKLIPLEALPFGQGYQRNFRECVYVRNEN